jgi:hypothetical protein
MISAGEPVNRSLRAVYKSDRFRKMFVFELNWNMNALFNEPLKSLRTKGSGRTAHERPRDAW